MIQEVALVMKGKGLPRSSAKYWRFLSSTDRLGMQSRSLDAHAGSSEAGRHLQSFLFPTGKECRVAVLGLSKPRITYNEPTQNGG
jgi:hypothetical protein